MAARNAALTHSQIAGTGVECVGLTCFHTFESGNPLSRAKAQMTRELQVTADNPQNHIAIAASAENRLPARSPSAVARIAITVGTSLPLASLAFSTAGMSLMASVSAIS